MAGLFSPEVCPLDWVSLLLRTLSVLGRLPEPQKSHKSPGDFILPSKDVRKKLLLPGLFISQRKGILRTMERVKKHIRVKGRFLRLSPLRFFESAMGRSELKPPRVSGTPSSTWVISQVNREGNEAQFPESEATKGTGLAAPKLDCVWRGIVKTGSKLRSRRILIQEVGNGDREPVLLCFSGDSHAAALVCCPVLCNKP